MDYELQLTPTMTPTRLYSQTHWHWQHSAVRQDSTRTAQHTPQKKRRQKINKMINQWDINNNEKEHRILTTAFFGVPRSSPTSEIHWQDTVLLDEEKLEVHGKKADMERGFKDLTSLHLCGSKQGVSYCGIENCSLPSIRLQVSLL